MKKEGLSRLAKAALLVLCLLPASGSASTLAVFSNSGASGGTISGNTVSGVSFNTINYNSQAYTVNTFIESYSNGVLTFAVSGGGSLSGVGLFSNVSGTFVTVDESAPLFGSNPQAVNLFNPPTTLNVETAFLDDIGLGSASQVLLDSGTQILVSSQANGLVISTETILSFTGTTQQLNGAPEPSSLSMLCLGMILFAAGSVTLRGKRAGLVRSKASPDVTHPDSLFPWFNP